MSAISPIDGSATWLSPWKFWFLLGLIIAVGLAARAFHYNLASLSDEQQYVTFARHLTEDVPVPARLGWSTRILWGWALNLWGQMQGISVESEASLMFLLAGLGIALTALIGKSIYGRAAGLIAAALIAVFPIDVRYDVMTTPDSLAWTMLLGSVLLFLRYLQSGGRTALGAAAFTAGLLIGVKDYYCFIIFCYIATLLAHPPFRADKSQWLILGLGFIAGLLPSFILQYLATGDFLRQFRAFEGMTEQYDAHDARRGFARTLLSELGSRFKYFNWLLLDNGPLGIVLILGLPFVASQAVKRLDCRTVFLAIVGYGVFLSLFPLRLSPLAFVEQQPRYAMVVLPFLAVGAGGSLASAMASLGGKKNVSASAAFALLIAGAISLWLPNYAPAVRGVPASVAVRACIEQAKEHHAATLIVPWAYHRIIPTSYYDRGVKIQIADLEQEDISRVDYGRIDEYLKAPGPIAVYVPPGMVDDPTIVELAKSPDFHKDPVLVPGSSLHSWLIANGKGKPDLVAGYVYLRD